MTCNDDFQKINRPQMWNARKPRVRHVETWHYFSRGVHATFGKPYLFVEERSVLFHGYKEFPTREYRFGILKC